MFIKLAIKRTIMQSCKHFYQQAIINFIQYIYYISLRDECEYLIRCNGKQSYKKTQNHEYEKSYNTFYERMFCCNIKFYKKNIIVTLNSTALQETYCFKIIW